MVTHRARYIVLIFSLIPLLAPLWLLAADVPVTVNDITQLNPIEVQAALAPTTLEEIISAIKTHRGPISIGGGRFSMGGQTATEGALQIDMRKFDKVVNLSKDKKEITVQSGITWRKIQEYIDPYDLSVSNMQTYANFTVGGSLSVNVHGRYIGAGSLVYSVKSFDIVLANGEVITASPSRNRDIFYGAIGGYGALGVIVQATLDLADNVKVERQSVVMALSEYKKFFFEKIRQNPDVIFHNADLYPTAFNTVRTATYVKTSKPLTEEHRLMPDDENYWLDRFCFQVVSEWPYGKAIRKRVIDPLLFRGEQVVWRNYEASRDAQGLEPASRKNSTYALQEYFVPVEYLEQFISKMSDILGRHETNVLNVSIRHAKQDPGTLLAWARTEVFGFVLYYKQGTLDTDRKAVGAWTRELIDAAISLGGSYYLPYQIHASENQFRAAYPDADKFFTLKRRLDPNNKFRNKLWDTYYFPTSIKQSAVQTPKIATKSGGMSRGALLEIT